MKPRISNLEVTVVGIKLSEFKDDYVSLEVEDYSGRRFYTDWGIYAPEIAIGTKLLVYDAEVWNTDKKLPELHDFQYNIIS